MNNVLAYRLFLQYKNNKPNIYDGTTLKTLKLHTTKEDYTSFVDMLNKTGLNKVIRITSAEREVGLAGNAGSKSWHTKRDSHGNSLAYDLVSLVPGKSVRELLIENPQMNQYILNRYGRYIDERSKFALLKNGATGAHEHVSFGGKGSKEGVSWESMLHRPKDKNIMYITNPTAPLLYNLSRLVNPYQAYLDIPILVNSLIPVQEVVLEMPLLPTQDIMEPMTILETTLPELVVTAEQPNDINYTNLLILSLNPYLSYLEPIELNQFLPNAVELLNLLAQAFIDLQRAIVDYNTLYGDNYDLYLSLEEANRKRLLDLRDLLFKQAMANIGALGGQLYDPVTLTFNPNNKIGDFVGTNNLIPTVRY